MSDPVPIADMTIEEVLTRWPQTADVFNRRNMACVGCPVAPFYSIAEASAVYNLILADFVGELEEVISNTSIQD